MNCQTSKEQISQFLDNELPQEFLQPLFQHLGECDECRNFFTHTKAIHDQAKKIEYVAMPKELDEKFAVLGMGRRQSILSRKFTISVSSVITSVFAAIVMVLFIYVSGTIQEKQIAQQYRRIMDLSMPYGTSSLNQN